MKTFRYIFSALITLLFLLVTSGVGIYEHYCLDCNEHETTLLPSHHHHSVTCSEEHDHVVTFHHRHMEHQQDCDFSFYKLENPFIDNYSKTIIKVHPIFITTLEFSEDSFRQPGIYVISHRYIEQNSSFSRKKLCILNSSLLC